jgi:hypothetical protein
MTWGALGAAALVLGAAVPSAVPSTPVFSFADPAITESSGLVDLGAFMVTTNDSGGGPLVYVIDPTSGRTIATTTYTGSVTDTEALAPAGKHAVWVGDIGDNTATRRSVQVYRVPVGRASRTVRAPSYDLVYPDGPHDAESLVQGPDGRLRIVTKSLLGGRVYTAPAKLDPNGPNKLVAGPPVDYYVTDAALFPGGTRILIRGYGGALIATFPGFRTLAEISLPNQEQGEGVSIASTGRIRLSSEGEHSKVLQISLPDDVRPVLSDEPVAKPSPGPTQAAVVAADDDGGLTWPWVAGGAAAVLVLGLVLGRRRR